MSLVDTSSVYLTYLCINSSKWKLKRSLLLTKTDRIRTNLRVTYEDINESLPGEELYTCSAVSKYDVAHCNTLHCP